VQHSLILNPEAVAAAAQTDLDQAGIAKTAREEKLQARAKAKGGSDHDEARDAEMERLYRKHVLKEPPSEPLLQIKGLGRPARKKEEQTPVGA